MWLQMPDWTNSEKNIWLQQQYVNSCKKKQWNKKKNRKRCKKKEPEFVCGWKATWLFGIWLQTWVLSDCKRLKCVITKNADLFSVTVKRDKKKKTEPVCNCSYLACVIATSSYVWLQKKRKRKPDFVYVLAKLLGYWNMIAILGSKVIAKI
jgi:hypothetical protein